MDISSHFPGKGNRNSSTGPGMNSGSAITARGPRRPTCHGLPVTSASTECGTPPK